MTELALLGSLLGMPSIFDPMFPVTYAAFFGSYPSWMDSGVDTLKVEAAAKNQGETADASGSLTSNVC